VRCYDGLLNVFQVVRSRRVGHAFAVFVTAGLLVAARLASQAPPNTYTVIAADGRRSLPFRIAGSTELLPLDQLAAMFGATIQEDTVAGGLVVVARGQRIALTPGQSLASISGRMVSLSGAVVKDGQSWQVPIDFVSRALGPALNLRLDVRRNSRLIVVGDVRVPVVLSRFERQGPNGRLFIESQPATTRRVSRDAGRLIVRFEADGIDAGPVAGAQPDFASAGRIDGSSLIIDLGPSSATLRIDDADPARLVIDLIPAGGAAPPLPGRASPFPDTPPVVDLTPPGVLRTIVIDPGHGGEDAGARGAGGAVEKDLTLQMAHRLKAAIESRLGLRVVLTRESDEEISVDRRAAFANNNKADVLISLHANASMRPTVRGAQVLSLGLDDYKDRSRGLPAGTPVPIAGGGIRMLEAVPWDLAQLPHAAQSTALAQIVARHLRERGVPMYKHATDQAPLRILVGANMPAVMVEAGFLTNADDERALAGELPASIVEALIATLTEIRTGIPVPPTVR
jgi:N-acetylmuramoyl-L-alanine amidase